MYGINDERFWHMNPKRVEPYKLAYERKVDFEAWTYGVYVVRAIGGVLSKGNKYPNQPLSMESHTNINEQISDAERFGLYALEINKSIKN